MPLETPTNGATNGVPTLYDAIGKPIPPRNDPAWQPPKDPLEGRSLGQVATAVSREIPLVVVATGWDVPSARVAMDDLVIGLFDAPAQMSDAIMRSDSRVQAALGSRLAIFGRPVEFKTPRKYRDSSAAQECLDAFVDAWPTMAAEPIMSELQRWAVILGFGLAQILWDTSGDYAIPKPLPWHPRYTYYDWQYRALVAITMDGQEPVIGGDGHWILHAPHGEYRGWMRGAISAITPWWLARHYALRDWARYSERHGLPMIKAITPAVGDPFQQAVFRAQLQNLGQETVFHLPQNPPPALSYDVELLEAKDTAHEGFRSLIEQCNMEITLALLAQNLTTEVQEGSYAAARVHADVRQSLLEADARALSHTVYHQLARPFAAMNFGNADLAPRMKWNVSPYEDNLTAAQTFLQFAQALSLLRKDGGIAPKNVAKLARTFGLDLGRFVDAEPVQAAAAKPPPGAAPKPEEKAPQGRRRVAPVRARIAMVDESEAIREALAMTEAERASRPARRIWTP